MRIIDKNTDFYDYYQNIFRDENLIFDRRDSFVLTKETLCDYLIPSFTDKYTGYRRFFSEKKNPQAFLLLQVCYTYWLFLIDITEENSYGNTQNYEVKLLHNWENREKLRKLCSLEIIRFYYYSRKKVKDLVKDIDTNNYKTLKEINHFNIYNGNKKIEKHIPLLKACGIAKHIDALQIYLAFEEYFSLEKTASERREPLNTTDIDKIESHGFDKKMSFRGKQNRKKTG